MMMTFVAVFGKLVMMVESEYKLVLICTSQFKCSCLYVSGIIIVIALQCTLLSSVASHDMSTVRLVVIFGVLCFYIL